MVAAAAAVALGLTLAGCTGPTGSAPNDDGTSAATESAGSADGGNGVQKGADLATAEFAVSWRDAVDIAKDGFPGELTEIELNWHGDSYAYTVELLSESHEHTAVVDAATGDVVENSGEAVESSDMPEKRSEVIEYEGLVPWDEALSTALDAQNGAVNEWKLEGTPRGPLWQFDIGTGSGEDAEVTINAETGELIEHDS